MISKKDLKSYDFPTIEDYYQYVVDSYTNSNLSQLRQLIGKLSKEQKKNFLGWCRALEPLGSDYSACINYVIEQF